MPTRLELLQDMLKKEPLDPFLNYAIALEKANAGDVQEAISIIEGILQRDENYLGAYYQLGKYYESTAQKEKAISIYRRGMEIAKKQDNRKTLGELNTALMLLDDE
jgi:tetratricopeptide (TPR) repeat protein